MNAWSMFLGLLLPLLGAPWLADAQAAPPHGKGFAPARAFPS
jgi:hypothetical protein